MINSFKAITGAFTETLNKLNNNGIPFNFIQKNEFLFCSEKAMNLRSYELIITEKYRYENKNKHSKKPVLYAVESLECALKDFFINQHEYCSSHIQKGLHTNDKF
jgi:competence protein ComGF